MRKPARVSRTGLLLAAVLTTLASLPLRALQPVEAEDFAGDDFLFPADIDAAGANLLFLGIARDQDNGEYQGEALQAWQAGLEEAGIVPGLARPWQFAVMESPPFFVKGIIRRGIGKSHEGKLPPDQGAVLFVKDIEAFARDAGVPLDGQPTVVLYSDGQVRAVFRGEISAENIAAVQAALTELARD